jgi:hypothetical protein
MAKETKTFQDRIREQLEAANPIELKQTLVTFTEEGQTVAGEFVCVKPVNTRFGAGSLVELANVDTGEVSSVFLSITLTQWFEENAPKKGDIIVIQYLGKTGRINNFKALRLEG